MVVVTVFVAAPVVVLVVGVPMIVVVVETVICVVGVTVTALGVNDVVAIVVVTVVVGSGSATSARDSCIVSRNLSRGSLSCQRLQVLHPSWRPLTPEKQRRR